MSTRTSQHSEAGRGVFGATDLLLLLMTAIWGANFSIIKHTFEDIAPLSFNGLRMSIAAGVLLLFALMPGRDLRVARADLPRFFILGLLSTTMYQTMFIVGAGLTRAGNAALILSTTPLFTAFISWLRKEEHFKVSAVAGLVLATAGIGLIVWGDGASPTQGGSLRGDLLVLAASVCWAFFTIGSRPLLHLYGSVKTTTLTMITGTPVLLAVCAWSLAHQNWSQVRPLSFGGLLYSALLSIVAAYIIWNHAVRKIGSTRTAIYSNLTPVIGLVIAWPVLGEVPTGAQIAGAVVIFVSIYLVRRGAVAVNPESVAGSEVDEASFPP